MAFKRVTDSGGGDIIKFDKVGTAVTGIYLGSESWPEGKFGPTVKHIIKTEAGIKVALFKEGSQPGKLFGQALPGQLIQLTFANTKASKGGGNPMKLYTLDIDDSYSASPEEVALGNQEYEKEAAETDTPLDEVTTSPSTSRPTQVNKNAVENVFKSRRSN